MPTTFRRRRSLLFMPGDSERKIEKATGLDADVIIADLEDGVALSRKDAARRTIVDAFSRLTFGSAERLIRINPASGPLWEDDLAQTLAARPHGYVLAKAESAAEIGQVARRLAELEADAGLPPGGIHIFPLIETARGVLAAGEIAGADDRVAGLFFGAEDLAGDLGARRSREGWEVFYARSAVVTAAAAYGLPAIDTVYVALDDSEGLAAECDFVRGLGFSGKLAIHPRQVAVINRCFTPDTAEMERARRLIAAFEYHQAEGAGVFEMDGQMVDMPMVRAARKVLAAGGEE